MMKLNENSEHGNSIEFLCLAILFKYCHTLAPGGNVSLKMMEASHLEPFQTVPVSLFFRLLITVIFLPIATVRVALAVSSSKIQNLRIVVGTLKFVPSWSEGRVTRGPLNLWLASKVRAVLWRSISLRANSLQKEICYINF